MREYIWLPEAEIAPTAASRAQIDRPIAVVDGVDTATPATYYVHTDHLHRPIRMTNAAKSFVWQAEYQPWGAVQSLSGALTLDLRFPGQWFQLEAGLHYNWHRHYDTSLGRYTQPDPLGFVDGPSVYGYAKGSPYRYVDPSGLDAGTLTLGGPVAIACPQCVPVVVGLAVIVVTGALVYEYICASSTADNDNSTQKKKVTCSEGFQICIKAHGGLLKAGIKCSQAKRACEAGQTTIFGPGVYGP